MSIKEKIDQLNTELQAATAESDRLWEIYQPEAKRVELLLDNWSKSYRKRELIEMQLNAMKELVSDHTAEQIEQDWSE